MTEHNGVSIRSVRQQDAAAFKGLVADSGLHKRRFGDRCPPPRDIDAWMHEYLLDHRQGAAYSFTIIAPNDCVVGACSLSAVWTRQRIAQFSYWIGDIYQGRGYASAGVKLVVMYAFEKLHLSRLDTCAFSSNVASIRILHNLGAVHTFTELGDRLATLSGGLVFHFSIIAPKHNGT